MYVKKFAFIFLILSVIIVLLLYYPPAPTKSEPGKTSGQIIFTPEGGMIEINGAEGASSGPSPNKNKVEWSNIGNAVIRYTVNNVSLALHLTGDSQEGRVVIDEAISLPAAVSGTPELVGM